MSQKVNLLSIHSSTALVLGFLLLFLGATSSTGQKHLQFAHLTVEDGLPQNTVHSIVRDKYGFMWFGTWNGLSRYDGYQFTNYHFDPDDSTSLVNNRVHLLYKDGAGDIWVSTFDTIVCRYNYETDNFTRFNPNELPEGLQDSTYRHNAHYYYEAENDEFRWEIRGHRLWQTDQSSGSSMAYHSGIFSEPALSNDIVYSIYLDETGILWVGTAMGGVNYVDVESDHFTYMPFVLEVDEHLIKAPVRTILVDADQLWLGSSANGWALTDKKTGLAEVLKPVRNPAFTSDNIRAMYLDKAGDVWMGYRMGLYRYHRDTEQIQRYHPDKVANTPYYVVSEDRSGTLWVGGFNNLLCYHRAADEFETYDLPFMETPSSVMALEFGRDRSIWAGTELSGLFRILRDPVTGGWTDTLVYARASAPGRQLPDNRVYSLLEDEVGHMWVGTGNGLCKVDIHTGAVKVFNKADGLADAYIAKILKDEAGHLWVSHKRGISRVDIEDETITNFTVRVANRGYEFMDGAGYRDSVTGRLYFGGLDGYFSFLPDKMQGNEYPPEARITHLYLNNERVLPGMEVGGKVLLQKPVYLSSSLVLDFNQRNFALEFSAMHYANPAHNRYAYRLEGFDSDWVKGDGRFRRAVYNGLPPGDYVFRLKAANSNGVWNSQEVTLNIRILPPWWRGPLAFAGYFLVFLLIVMGVYYVFLVKWRLKHQIELERFEIDKLKEMQSLRSRFFTSISHELRTPLTLILDPVERMINTEIAPEDKRRYLSLIQKNAQRLLRLLNQLLAFKRIESGHESFNWQPTALQKLLYAIYASFEVKAATRGIDYRFENSLPDLAVWADADKMEKIFYNLLGNAFKYTPEGGRISMEISEVAGRKREPEGPVYVQISVRDSGVGIAPEVQNQIFELFYKADELADQNSNGVGLAYIRELVLLHKGEITVESQAGKGACFKVVLPLKEVHDKSINLDTPGSDLALVDEGNPSITLEAEADVEAATILLVEDDHDIRNYMAETLQPFYQVLQASNGQMGFERALKNHPDLVITDVVMPELSGLELCEKLRNDMRTCFIPVIMLTSLSDSEAHIEGVESGADVYLTKPFQSTLLLAQIRRLLASRDQIRERLISTTDKVSSEPSRASVEKPPVDEFLSRVRQHVEEGVFDVQELAECLHLSRTQLYRKVKATSGQSVSELLTGIRMKFAADLLRSGENNVNEVADRLGYSEPGNFSRAFQKYYGRTPRSFMQTH